MKKIFSTVIILAWISNYVLGQQSNEFLRQELVNSSSFRELVNVSKLINNAPLNKEGLVATQISLIEELFTQYPELIDLSAGEYGQVIFDAALLLDISQQPNVELKTDCAVCYQIENDGLNNCKDQYQPIIDDIKSHGQTLYDACDYLIIGKLIKKCHGIVATGVGLALAPIDAAYAGCVLGVESVVLPCLANCTEPKGEGNKYLSEIQDIRQVYPIPSDGIVNVDYYSRNAADVQFLIYDVIGNEMYYRTEKMENGERRTFQFNLSDLKSGIYFVEVRIGDVTNRAKIVIER